MYKVNILKQDYSNIELVNINTNETLQYKGEKYNIFHNDECNINDNGNLHITFRQLPTYLVGELELYSSYRLKSTTSTPVYLFKPLDKHYPLFYVHSNCRSKYGSNILISIHELQWKARHLYPSGRILDVYGAINNISAMELALAHHNDLIHKPLKQEIKGLFPHVEQVNGGAYTIDPEGCTDIDDAFSIIEDKEKTTIWIHITDVYGRFDDSDDLDAIILQQKQQESIYFKNSIQHMLPTKWIDDFCSLKEGNKYYTLSLNIDYYNDGRIKCDFKKVYVYINKNYNYENSVNVFTKYYEIIQKIYDIFINKYGYTSNRLRVIDTHTFIEAMMIIYNLYFGNVVCKDNEYKIMRIQKPSLYENDEKVCYDKTLIKYLQTLQMNRAVYDVTMNGKTSHSSLGLYNYTHATSPLRRKVDLLNQMLYYECKNLKYPTIYGIISDINDFQKKLKKMYRELNKLYMLERVYYSPNYKTKVYVYDCKLEKNSISLYFPNEKLSFKTHIIPYEIRYMYDIYISDNKIIIKNKQEDTVESEIEMMKLLNVRINGQPKLSEINNIMIEFIKETK